MAQAGSYHSGFNGGAPKQTTMRVGATNEYGRSVVLTADRGLMVLVDLRGDIGLMKFDLSGNPVSSFGTNGTVTIDFGSYEYPFSMIEYQGRFYIAGFLGATNAGGDGLVLAVNGDGTLDTTFGNNGRVVVDAGGASDRFYGARFGADGSLYAAGSRNDGAAGFLVKLTPQGLLDTSFDGDGIVIGSMIGEFAYAEADANGKVTVSAYVPAWPPDPAIVRYLPNGAPDSSFGVGGYSIRSLSTLDDKVRSLYVDSQGRYLAGGWHTNVINASSGLDACIIRWNADGTLDATFGASNYVCLPFGLSSSSDYTRTIIGGGDDSILVAGTGATAELSRVGAVARLLPSGALDTNFGISGVTKVTQFTGFNEALGATRDPVTGVMYFVGYVVDPSSAADVLLFALNP